MTVLSILDVHSVESPPGGFTAGLVLALKPGWQQKAVVSGPEVPAIFFVQPDGQMPGE